MLESEAFAHGSIVFTAGLRIVAMEAHIGRLLTTKQTQTVLELVNSGYYSEEERDILIAVFSGLLT